MNKLISHIHRTYLDPEFDLRVRLFNVLVLGATVVGALMTALSIVDNTGLMNILSVAIATLLLAFIAYFSNRSKNYPLWYMVMIIGVFVLAFPFIFFSTGAYLSGMPMFMIFAVVFTVFMLEGKKAILMVVIEMIVYLSALFIAKYYPQTVNWFETDTDIWIDVIVAFLVVGISLAITMYVFLRLYNAQQKKLDEQNAVLAQANRTKTEFLANTSHEMRTPLTVISVNIQTVAGILRHMDGAVKDPEATELLADAQEEIMRLARMVGGMLSLNSMSESAEKSRTDLSALLCGTADMLRLFLSKRGNDLQIEAGDGLMVFGDADLLSQVVVNLIQNSHAHTENDVIRLYAARVGSKITVTVSDNGSGIAPELLPRVFERGVSEGGTGVGLFLCKTVVESHGGEIQIESQQGKGTTVTFTLPVYQGQYGGDAE